MPFTERSRINDEYLAAIIELWTQDLPAWWASNVSFSGVAFEPKPCQKPHLPLWIGGEVDAALKRAARFAFRLVHFPTKPKDIPGSSRINQVTTDLCTGGPSR